MICKARNIRGEIIERENRESKKTEGQSWVTEFPGSKYMLQGGGYGTWDTMLL